MIPNFSKRLLISFAVAPLMLSAAALPAQSATEKPCTQECPFWGIEDWNAFFNRPFPRTGSGYTASSMTETDKAYLITIDLPGMDRKDIRVETSGERLSVSGERKDESESKEKSQRSYSRFQQSYMLPADADLSAVEAVSKNGVLKITVPKSPVKKNMKKIEIR
jgi:HSP20 family protein